MLHILEGESLLNDASGLVCLRFAIAAALSGSFSPGNAALTFGWTALAGAALGAGVTWAAITAKAAFTRRFGDDSGSNVLVSLLIPFGAYLAAEHVNASGVLAAAASGIAMTFVGGPSTSGAASRIRRRAVWDMLQFTLNGVTFVLLGEQLPEVFTGARRLVVETGHQRSIWLLVYAVAIVVVLAALRFVWVWLSLQLTLLRARQRGDSTRSSPPLRIIAAMSVAGARGAITLAGALTIPLTLGDGSPFPARDLVIFLACGVILASLMVAAVGLPYLLHNLRLPDDFSEVTDRDNARIEGAKAAIVAIEAAQHRMGTENGDADRYAEIATQIIDLYRDRVDTLSADDADKPDPERMRIERDLRLVAITAERQKVFEMARRGEVRLSIADQIGRELDWADERLVRISL